MGAKMDVGWDEAKRNPSFAAAQSWDCIPAYGRPVCGVVP